MQKQIIVSKKVQQQILQNNRKPQYNENSCTESENEYVNINIVDAKIKVLYDAIIKLKNNLIESKQANYGDSRLLDEMKRKIKEKINYYENTINNLQEKLNKQKKSENNNVFSNDEIDKLLDDQDAYIEKQARIGSQKYYESKSSKYLDF